MVSVIMATYNGEKYIEKQLESIACQTQPPDEVIICDDCSTDETVKCIEEYINRNKLVGWKVFRNKKNLGYYDNFFQAIFLAEGDTIYLSDQDDVWDLNKIQTFETFYIDHPKTTMIQSNIVFIDESGESVASSEYYHGKKQAEGFVPLYTADMCRFAGSGYTMSFRKSVKEKLFQFGLNKQKAIFQYHDVLIGLMAIALGECYLCMDIQDCHRLHNANATQTQNESFIANRTKRDQLDILKRRVQGFELIKKYTEDNKECFEHFISFAQDRIELIEKRKVSRIYKLIKNIECYSSKAGLITDILYGFGFEKLLLKLYKKL